MFQYQNRGYVGQSQLYYPASQGLVYQPQQQQAPMVRMSFSPGVQYGAPQFAQNSKFSQTIRTGVPVGDLQQRGISPITDLRPQSSRVQYQSNNVYPRGLSQMGQVVQGGSYLQSQKVPITYVQGDNIRRLPGGLPAGLQYAGQVTGQQPGQLPGQIPGKIIGQPQFLRGSNIIIPGGPTALPGNKLDTMVDQAIARTQKVLKSSPGPFKSSPSHRKYVVQEDYEGEVVADKREGHGTYKYKNGDVYEGQWYGDKRNGFGCLYDKDKSEIYTGDWNDDKFSGHGILHNKKIDRFSAEFDFRDFSSIEDRWERYEGEFQDGKKKGLGTFYLSNGEKFNGKFKDDVIHGEGTFYTRGGKIIIGHWDNNKLTRTI